MEQNRRASTATDLAELVRDDPELQAEVRKDPVEALERLSRPLENDYWIYRIVVGSLALSIFAVIVATTLIVLTQDDVQIPDVLVALGTGAIGALAGLLAPVSSGREALANPIRSYIAASVGADDSRALSAPFASSDRSSPGSPRRSRYRVWIGTSSSTTASATSDLNVP